ncbi:MAG: hypothetical protein HZC36_08095 [Armatimonadetes bacterium]|nr:hypothetical protein [Armatimonadota bacterium]
MIKPAAILTLAACALPHLFPEDQAYFAILAETKVGRMAGMPPMDLSGLPPGIKLPPQAMAFSGQPTRLLNIRLWSPTIAPADAKASVAPPAGLKQGAKLDLELYRPDGKAAGGKVRDFDPDANPESFTIKVYWGSSETVKENQPKVITWSGISDDQKEAMKNRVREANMAGESYYYKEGWTTGYWPTKSQPGSIDKAASLSGKYSLTTSYTGNVDIEAPSNVEFMAPIMMSSPNLDRKIDLKKAMNFKWDAIPNALGLNASIVAMEGKNTMIIWTSSEVFNEALMGDMGFLQMAEVRDFVAKTLFMAGDRTSVNVPAGIFANADFVMMQMAGYGPGAALDKAQPLPRIQTKTSLMLMLGGKKMTGF